MNSGAISSILQHALCCNICRYKAEQTDEVFNITHTIKYFISMLNSCSQE